MPGRRRRRHATSEHAAGGIDAAAGGLIEGTRDLANARTAAFTVLVFAQLFNCFNARSETTSAFAHLFVNPWLWGAVAVSLLLQVAVVHLGVLNVAFGTEPLTLSQWGVCAAMGSVVLWSRELRKLVTRAVRPVQPSDAGRRPLGEHAPTAAGGGAAPEGEVE